MKAETDEKQLDDGAQIVGEVQQAENVAISAKEDGNDWSTTRLELWAFYVYYIVRQPRNVSLAFA